MKTIVAIKQVPARDSTIRVAEILGIPHATIIIEVEEHVGLCVTGGSA